MQTDLSDLLAHKNFEYLTPAERTLVLSEISEQDYNDQREMIVRAQLIMTDDAAGLIPSPAIAVAASKVFHQKKKGGIIALFAHKVPTWAAVAASLLLFTLFNYSGVFGTTVQNENIAVTPRIDTVFIENFITEFRDLKPFNAKQSTLKDRPQRSENISEIPPASNPSSVQTLPSYSDEMLNAEQVNFTALLQNHSSSNGVSFQNDSIAQSVNRAVY